MKKTLSWPCALAIAALACTASLAAAADQAPAKHKWKAGDPIPSLKDAYKGQFLVGAAVGPGMVLMGDSNKFVERQYNVVTAENEMKPLTLTKKEGVYEWTTADDFVAWANKAGVKVRGHCLVWHQQAAPWMFTKDGQPVSRELLIERMRKYIHDVVGHFKGKVWAWDVVNEAFVANEPNIDSQDGWRKSDWYKIIGPDFIPLAFQFAHEADPDALLFYNDYETQAPFKRQKILEMVKALQKKGIRIDGIGHQSHYYLQSPPVSDLEDTIVEVSKLGLRNSITELDISMRDRWGASVPLVNDTVEAAHAKRYAEFFHMFRKNKDKIDAVVIWGVNDESSWLKPPDEPLLFTEFEPKPQFWAVYDEASAPLK